MKRKTIFFAGIACVAAALALAGQHHQSWSGFLVDLSCYAALERNTNPTDTQQSVDRDRDREVQFCSPKPNTRSFALVDHDGMAYPLDSAGNLKASELVNQAATKSPLEVNVKGAMGTNAIQVVSISPKK